MAKGMFTPAFYLKHLNGRRVHLKQLTFAEQYLLAIVVCIHFANWGGGVLES